MWEDVLKNEPKHGPMMDEKTYLEYSRKELEEMSRDISSVANMFDRNAEFLRSLIGNEEAKEVLNGIGMTLRTYGRHLQSVAGSTDYAQSPRLREKSAKDREYLETEGQKLIDLAKEIMQM